MNFELVTTPSLLPDLLDWRGILRLLPAAYYDTFERNTLRAWCHRYARYGLPTVELVDWLRTKLDGRRAIEIGSGSGDLAFHLGIPATDSRIQEEPEVEMFYRALDQPTIRYPSWVERFEAHLAVAHYQPDVVVASWVTQWDDSFSPSVQGSMFGVHEGRILETGCEYILLGNLASHGRKKIMDLPHRELVLPFLHSRAAQPELDRLFIWNEK